jgi:4-hydroxybenzoate polyprenyltransferase
MPMIFNRFTPYIQLMRLHRPIGIFLLLWPTLWALWIAAHGLPNIKVLIIFILGTIVMRSAGCVINDYADRNFDGLVERTKQRPLAIGALTSRAAIILFISLIVIALILVLQLNWLTIKLSVIGLLLAIIYPFTKRFFQAPQLVLGVTFAWSVPMAFAAQTNTVPAIAWLVFIIALLWPIAYDTLYAMVDIKDDQKIGIKSTAILFGRYDRFWIAITQLLILLLLLGVGVMLQLKNVYFLSLGIGLLLFVYQHYLIKDREPQKCFRAFLNNNWFGLIILLGIVL